MSTEEVLSAIVDGVAKGSHMVNLSWEAVFRVALLLLGGMAAIRLLMKLVDRILRRSQSLSPLGTYIRAAVRVLLWCLLALMVAGSLHVDVTSIIALLSVAGLAVSLSLQNTLSNLAGGITLMTIKPFQEGDFVETDGVSGVVSTLGLAYTTFVTYDNKQIFVPNSQLSAAKIINYTALGRRRADLFFTAAYSAPTQQVFQALQQVLDSLPLVLADPAPTIHIEEYQASRIRYAVRAWAASQDYWTVYYQIQEGVREAFVRHGIDMAFDRVEVRLVEETDENCPGR